MRRGEIWSYEPQGIPRQPDVVIVSSDGINESERTWLLAVVLTQGDPEDILAVSIPEHGWTYAGSVIRVYRPWLARHVDTLQADTMDRIDGALRAALDL